MIVDDSNLAAFDALTKAAEQLLVDAFNHPIHITKVERLSEHGRRNLLLRGFTSSTGSLSATFIIKKVEADIYEPDNPDSWDTQRFFNDWTGSQFLSAIGNGAKHSPHFYGGSRDLGFIIMEDLGPHRSLVEPLLHEDAMSAEQALLRYSRCLGKLHADTTNKFNQFKQLFHAVNPMLNLVALDEKKFEEFIQQAHSRFEDWGVVREVTLLEAELRNIMTAIMAPGPFLAYIHGDPCPDNVFDTNEQMRLIDFEFGHFGHALIDATYSRMVFPTCWCANRLPKSIITQMENQYRAELVQGCPQAQEDSIFEAALVTVCGSWLLRALAQHLEAALVEDESWGIASIRQRILARLESFVITAEEFSQLPALADAASRLLELLSQRWPETVPLPLYPAFQDNVKLPIS